MSELEGARGDRAVVDHGYSWVVLASCFLLSVIAAGNFASNGVFFVEFVEYFRVTKAEAAIIGCLDTGLSGLSGIFLGAITSRFGVRSVVMVGSVVMATGYFASWLVSNFAALYVFFGILPGIGMGCFNIGYLTGVMQYFKKRRALALGIQATGFSLGVFITPQLTRYLISQYSWRGAVLILAGIQLNGLVCGALIRPQPEEKSDSNPDVDNTPKSKLQALCDYTILKDIKITLHFISVSLIIAGDNIPYLFLPAKAVAAGIEKTKAVFLIAILGLTSGISRTLCGFIGDRLGRHRAVGMAVSAILAGILMSAASTLQSLVALSIYAVATGILAAGYITLLLAVQADLSPPDKLASANGFILFFFGAMTLIGSPIAGLLVDVSGSYGTPFLVFGFVTLTGGATTCVTYVLQRRDFQKPAIKEVDVSCEDSV